ncbi:amidohydrolase family protein [Tsuneonella suprasediminis]|uniref:amidohydrolase family protein n=1 Tax=Tsuneonella suprasediminis TaxID=2306996 RepID=UPI002F92AD60
MAKRPPLVDPHVHLWDLSHIRYPWLSPPFDADNPNGSVQAIAVDYSLDSYLEDASAWDVCGIVHIDAGAHPGDAIKETRWLQRMADRCGKPNAIVAFAMLEDKGVEAVLEAQSSYANVRGIRQIVSWHPDPARSYGPEDITLCEEWERGFGLLNKYGLSFDLQAYPGQMDHLAGLIGRHPDTQVILNHTGMAIPGDEDGWNVWRSGMRALAALPNVAVKISGMGFTWNPWSEEQVRPYVLDTIEIFGIDRAMFASNFPTDKLFACLDKYFNAYNSITSAFSNDERAALFGGNANRIYRMGLKL